ncbi:hypothetical protein C8Q80DRAFT_1121800 [Daedaleopsis nitida]|nr:hypothetical protein C8Q80DRAFT_1121800 [Daedaleopsis nitida]
MSTHAKSPSEGLTIMFEHCTDQLYYHDSGISSGRSSPTNSSPATPVDLFPHSPLDVVLASEDTWNLIPYDVPWGPEYYHYRSGTLPGPDGTCIFLRSPTPLKNRRTQKACNKCRQRKAKCSGTRPTCTRCLARGYLCEYVEEDKLDKRHSTQSSGRHRPYPQREGSACSDAADASYSASDCESYRYATKSEEPSTPELVYPDTDADSLSNSSPVDYSPHWVDSQYSMASSYGYDNATAHPYGEPAPMHDYYEQSSSYPIADDAHVYHSQNASPLFHEAPEQHPLAAAVSAPAAPPMSSASVHAPRPLRCTGGSPLFLSPEERLGAFAVPAEAQAQAQLQGLQGLHLQAMQPQPHPHTHHARNLLINLAPAAVEPAPQIALPQVPPMPPTIAEAARGHAHALDEGAVAVGYAQHAHAHAHAQVHAHHAQGLYCYPPAEPALQYPYLQYQYAMPTYAPGELQDAIEPAMLYTMPMMMA